MDNIKQGEPNWEKMPALIQELRDSCVHNVISGARIGAACGHHGLRKKTGALIAVLKGTGIISPKLMLGSAYIPKFFFGDLTLWANQDI